MALKNVRYRLHGQIRPWPGFEGSLRGLERSSGAARRPESAYISRTLAAASSLPTSSW